MFRNPHAPSISSQCVAVHSMAASLVRIATGVLQLRQWRCFCFCTWPQTMQVSKPARVS